MMMMMMMMAFIKGSARTSFFYDVTVDRTLPSHASLAFTDIPQQLTLYPNSSLDHDDDYSTPWLKVSGPKWVAAIGEDGSYIYSLGLCKCRESGNVSACICAPYAPVRPGYTLGIPQGGPAPLDSWVYRRRHHGCQVRT